MELAQRDPHDAMAFREGAEGPTFTFSLKHKDRSTRASSRVTLCPIVSLICVQKATPEYKTIYD